MPPQGCRSIGAVGADGDEADLAAAHRRLHRHGAHEPRVGLEFGVRDPLVGDGVVGCDDRRDRLGQLVLVDRARVLDVEVEPAFLGADLPACDGKFHETAQQMQRGVHAHVLVPRLPVERDIDGVADVRLRSALGRDVNDRRLVGVVDRRRNGASAASEGDRALVTGLTASARIKRRLVEHDAAALVDGENLGACRSQIGVAAVELLGHAFIPDLMAAS